MNGIGLAWEPHIHAYKRISGPTIIFITVILTTITRYYGHTELPRSSTTHLWKAGEVNCKLQKKKLVCNFSLCHLHIKRDAESRIQ